MHIYREREKELGWEAMYKNNNKLTKEFVTMTNPA